MGNSRYKRSVSTQGQQQAAAAQLRSNLGAKGAGPDYAARQAAALLRNTLAAEAAATAALERLQPWCSKWWGLVAQIDKYRGQLIALGAPLGNLRG